MGESFEAYAERMKQIRSLATPTLEEIRIPEDYSRVLKINFQRIGEMAAENRRIIADCIQPVLKSEETLSPETRKEIEHLNELLVNDENIGEIDIHLSQMLVSRLFHDEINLEETLDENARIILLAKMLRRDYYLITELSRNQYSKSAVQVIRGKAVEILRDLDTYVAHDLFLTLSEEARSAVLLSSVFGVLLYIDFLESHPDSYYAEMLGQLELAERVLADSFYRENMPDYDWESYEFRIYYYGSFLANSRLNRETARKIYQCCERLIRFLETCTTVPILNACSKEPAENLLLSAGVKAGIVPVRDACERIFSDYEKRNTADYSGPGIDTNLDTPSKYLCFATEQKMDLNVLDIDRFNHIARSMLNYLYRLPKRDINFARCVSLFQNLIIYYQEKPGCMTMADLCLSSFAALHPPTYVHVNIVAKLTESMTRHLLRTRPELFLRFPGTGSLEAVREKEEEIIRYAYHAALCHDIGKLYILDVISMYGRAILDEEFRAIKTHPVIGAELALRFASIRDYADVIRGHHVWYDGSGGYPQDFDTARSPYKIIIDIVMAADCLDAATDTIGRSYSRGKTFDMYRKEVEEGAGTYYAPFLPELFSREECREDISYLLGQGRERMYRETYRLLKRML